MFIDKLKILGFSEEHIAEAVRSHISPLVIGKLLCRYAGAGSLAASILKDILDELRWGRESLAT